jgi:TrmH family RNA methyltransferase
MKIKEVSSIQNTWYKEVKNLIEKNRFRKAEGRFTVEGFSEIRMAMAGGYELESIAFEPDRISSEELSSRLKLSDLVLGIALPEALMKTLIVREDRERALAIFKVKGDSSNELKSDASILILEGIEKPGNLGAILRSAEASGLDEIWLCDAKVDCYHPQVIRNSLGTVFHVPVRNLSFEACLERIQNEKITLYTTFIDNSDLLFEADMTKKFALVMGTEHEGVQSRWQGLGQNLVIPMLGKVDSLNVSVASAVFLFEMVRQRRKK